ncbi:unnamed protein product [Paramecium sonneborni]|uniref:Uncharacterized protein n=1 Tax=Paramecium sonneborni TaxID=65129 RepID=A0A8S1R7L7_9CILI|nr:unnamed protein product [Paramecium sonneborni]
MQYFFSKQKYIFSFQSSKTFVDLSFEARLKCESGILNQRFQQQINPKLQIQYIKNNQLLNSPKLSYLIQINSKAFDDENNQILLDIIELLKRNNYTSSYITLKSTKKLIHKRIFYRTSIEIQMNWSIAFFFFTAKPVYNFQNLNKILSKFLRSFIKKIANSFIKVLAQAIMALCFHFKLQFKSIFKKKCLNYFQQLLKLKIKKFLFVFQVKLIVMNIQITLFNYEKTQIPFFQFQYQWNIHSSKLSQFNSNF